MARLGRLGACDPSIRSGRGLSELAGRAVLAVVLVSRSAAPRPGVIAQAEAVVGSLAASACPLPERLVMAVRFAAIGWRLGGLRARLARRRAFVSGFLGHRDRRR